MIGKGVVKGNNIFLNEPLSLPEGTEVLLQIEPVTETSEKSQLSPEEFVNQPCFGMWANREDMKVSEDWVERERKNWNLRLDKQV